MLVVRHAHPGHAHAQANEEGEVATIISTPEGIRAIVRWGAVLEAHPLDHLIVASDDELRVRTKYRASVAELQRRQSC